MHDRFAEAIRRIDAANAEDPRSQIVDRRPQSRELLFSQRTYDWIPRLVDSPSEELLLAARGHTLRRWMIPRDGYPKTNLGYHEWRDALARFHADQAAAILREVGYPDATIERVSLLITRQLWPQDPEARALEDADCLVFLETKLAGYIDDWGEAKTVQILKGTWGKMTPKAREFAKSLDLAPRERELLKRAAPPSA